VRLHVENIGKVRKADIDLRPLTVFVGDNNTNKSWVAYAAYGCLQGLAGEAEVEGSVLAGRRVEFAGVDVAAEAAARALAPALDIKQDGEWNWSLSLQDASVRATAGTSSLGGSALMEYLGPSVDGGDAQAILTWRGSELRVGHFQSLLLAVKRVRGELFLDAIWSSTEFTTGRTSQALADPRSLRKAIAVALQAAVGPRFRRVFPFPVERQTTSVLFGGARSDGPHVEAARPLADFLHHELQRVWWAARVPGSAELDNAVRRILGGVVEASPEQGITFTPTGGPRLPLAASASMVRSLASVALYLKRKRPGDVLVIDEPEMNAHPRAQLGLAELFAMLVNSGTRIICTTHSPYFVDHLSNLMQIGGVTDKRRRAALVRSLELKSSDAILDPKMVAVYEFADVTRGRAKGEVRVRSILDAKEPDIRTSTFGEQSDRVTNTYLEAAFFANKANDR
jgi:hypothetical protein